MQMTKCEECVAFVPATLNPGTNYGTCHRHAPSPVLGAVKDEGAPVAWPLRLPKDGCCEGEEIGKDRPVGPEPRPRGTRQ